MEQNTLAPADLPSSPGRGALVSWNYKEAFSRNLGILTEAEQEKLRNARVAIAGMGGVGGLHLMTLVRLGIGHFTIADPDVYELANFNRQYGANVSSIGRSKVEVMAEAAKLVNPEVEIRVLREKVGAANVSEFLEGADVLVDGLDFFVIEARRLVFREARQLGIWAVTAGPHAFSTAWLLFSPGGMTFDRFFDLHDGMSETDKIVAFSVGCVPSPIHLSYLNFREYFQPGKRKGASLGLACQFASGIVGTEVARILLNREGLRAAPWYFQFDSHRHKLCKGWLWNGNRHPWQRAKRWWLKRRMESQLSAAISRP